MGDLENQNGEEEGQVTPPVDGEGSQKESTVTLEMLQDQNRVSQEQIAELRQGNELLQQMVINQQAGKEDSQPSYQDDFFDEEEDRALENKISKKIDPIVTAMAQQTLEVQEQNIRITNPDYDEVIKYTQKQMTTNADLAYAIKASKNPALSAYNFGLSNPERQDQDKETMRQSLMEEMRTGKLPQTLGNANGLKNIPDASNEVNKINQESTESFQNRLQAIRNS